MINPLAEGVRTPPWLMAALAAVFVGCGGYSPTNEQAVEPASIILSADSLAFFQIGDTQRIAAEIFDDAGLTIDPVQFGLRWHSTDSAVVTVGDGLVTARGNGTAEVVGEVGGVQAAAIAVVDALEGTIAFLDRSEPLPGVFLINADGSDVRMAFRGTEALWPSSLDLSPDGQRIAFLAGPRYGRSDLFVHDIPSGMSVRIGLGAFWGAPDWSPDGVWIAVAGSQGLTIVRGDGAERRDLQLEFGAPSQVVWSPTGERLAFTWDDRRGGCLSCDHTQIWITDVGDILTPTPVRPGLWPVSISDWSIHDELFYRHHSTILGTIRPDGTSQETLPFDSEDAVSSPDAKRIALTQPGGIWAMNRDGSDGRWILEASQPRWITSIAWMK